MHLRHDYAQATSKSLRDENRDLRLSFLPALSKLLYIVNKQLTQAKEAKKTHHCIFRCRENQSVQPYFRTEMNAFVHYCAFFLQLLQTVKFFAEALEDDVFVVEKPRKNENFYFPNIHNVYVYQANQALWSRM